MLFTQVLSHISLEPVMFLYFCTLALTGLSSQNLLLQKVCLGGTVAPPIGVRECHDEIRAQKEVTFIQTWKELIVLVGPVVFVMFAGPWSDSHGRRRKPLMYLPILGQVIADLLCILNVYFWSWSPSVAALSGSVPPAVTGWRSCFTIGVITFVCDNSTEKSRTMKVGISNAMYFLASPCGSLVFGLVFNEIGFYGVHSLSIAMNVTAVLYLFLLIPENPVPRNEVKLKAWEKLIDPNQVVQCFKTVFKKRDENQRAVVISSIAVAPLTLAPFMGEYEVLYFFLRHKFHWDAVDFGYYAAYKLLVIFCVVLPGPAAQNPEPGPSSAPCPPVNPGPSSAQDPDPIATQSDTAPNGVVLPGPAAQNPEPGPSSAPCPPVNPGPSSAQDPIPTQSDTAPNGGTCVTLGVFSHVMGLSDATIGAMSMVTLVITAAANAFATSPWEMFLYPVIDFMHGASLAVVYSIISKNVDSSERGQVNSVVGIADALFPLFNTPLYNQFYNHTFEQMPGAFFLLSTVYGVISFFMFFVIYILQKKTKQAETNTGKHR